MRATLARDGNAMGSVQVASSIEATVMMSATLRRLMGDGW